MRDYKKEYENYQGKPEQIKKRASRNKARSLLAQKYGKSAIAGKDVNHRDRNPLNNSMSNLNIQSKSTNRSNNQ
ncbi:MAG: uncultured Mediterranean phage [Bacteroidota bacterium]|jgi:hypothetical protein